MNLFQGIIRDENTTTELLKNYLRNSKTRKFRDKFLRLIGLNCSIEELSELSIETQIGTQSNGRPDIILTSKKIKILIEVKIKNSDLTSNQPKGYYYELVESTEEKKYLILLIPRYYQYWQKYNDRLNEVYEAEQNIICKTLIWSDVARILKELDDTNLLINELREYIYDNFNPIEMPKKEAFDILQEKKSAKAVKTIINTIKEVQATLNKESISTKNSKGDFLIEYGFHLSKLLKIELFFGEWFEYWEDKEQPFCIAFIGDENKLEKFIEITKTLKLPKVEKFKYGWYVTYVEVEKFLKEGSFNVDGVCSMLKRYNKELAD